MKDNSIKQVTTIVAACNIKNYLYLVELVAVVVINRCQPARHTAHGRKHEPVANKSDVMNEPYLQVDITSAKKALSKSFLCDT